MYKQVLNIYSNDISEKNIVHKIWIMFYSGCFNSDLWLKENWQQSY